MKKIKGNNPTPPGVVKKEKKPSGNLITGKRKSGYGHGR